MNKLPVKMTKMIDESDLFDMLTGACHEQYPWWAYSSTNEETMTYTISGFKAEVDEDDWDDENPDTYTTITLDVPAMISRLESLPNDASGRLIAVALDREDFDANDADCFWQIALYGEVVFG